ncbi:MAG: S8/S53 family peptidase [Halanaerobiales bacterium]|nr:S8/S53 family peptidase [Halanaerobiales bacterium]
MKKVTYILVVILLLLSLLISSCVAENSSAQKDSESKTIINDKQEISEFADLRQGLLMMQGKSLRDMDLSNKYEVLLTATFDTHTQWPPKDKLPEKFNPQQIIEIGKDPGLQIRDLHKQGFTGKGVKVAIIDQPLLLGHEEYKDRLEKYTTIDCEGVDPHMHGTAIASLLVGKSCGVAPNASLYYWAEPTWKQDYKQRTLALEQIIEYNKDKPLSERIRVVSVSIGYIDSFDNLSSWKAKIKEAEANGIIVVHCSHEEDKDFCGIGCDLYKDRNNPENYNICYFVGNNPYLKFLKLLYVPIDNRTTADFQGENDYTFWSKGGLSWGAPYLAGVIALGLQANPNVEEEDIYKYLKETGTSFNGGYIINPKAFIQKIKEMN